jgi:hypothetical protein
VGGTYLTYMAIQQSLVPSTHAREVRAIQTLTFFLALATLMHTAYEAVRIEETRASSGFLTDFPYTLNGLHLMISLGLALCAVGLWLPRRSGLCMSLTALAFVLLIYGYWHLRTTRYLKEFAETRNYNRLQAEVGLFHGATRWDFVILVLVGVLFLWLIRRLFKTATLRS